MKYLIFLLVTSLSLVFCQNNGSPTTGAELQKLKAELEEKKKELSNKQEIAEIEKELEYLERQIKLVDKGISTPVTSQKEVPTATPNQVEPNIGTSNGPKGTIIGNNVTLRKEATVQSEKLGSFRNNEGVDILETRNSENENEAILKEKTSLTGNGAVIVLPKGKAVVIESYNAGDNNYTISYQDLQKGQMTAEISASAVETITYSTWYKVRRENGETGWVLGRFLKTN
jgi:hypothetical protein